MGYVRTIAKMLWRLAGETTSARGAPPNLTRLVTSSMQIPPREFGRFKNLRFASDLGGSNLVGTYTHGFGGEIGLTPYDEDIARTFIHELVHARQHRPNQSELELIRGLFNAGALSRKIRGENPIEALAQDIELPAGLRPRGFSRIFRGISRSPQYENLSREASEVVAGMQRKGRWEGPYNDYDAQRSYLHARDLQPYSGKGWLYGLAAGLTSLHEQLGGESGER